MVTLRQESGWNGAMALLAAVLMLAVPHSSASAGAWLQDEGRSQIIFANAMTGSTRRFDRRGRPIRSGQFSKQESAIHLEHGWSDHVTLLGSLRAQNQTFPLDGTPVRIASGALGGGARVRLWAQGGTILSAQAMLHATTERSLTGPLRRMDSPAEAELRLNLGHTLALGHWPTFVELQTAYRWRGGSNPDELRLDAGFGVRPMPALLLLLQSHNTITTGKSRFGESRARQHKVQASAVYDLSAAWSLQISAFGSLGGRETIREQGVQIAWWRRL